MPRTTFASVTLPLFAMLPLLAVLALAMPGTALAGPPEAVSGKMVLDEVAEKLRRCGKEPDEDRRLELLFRLARSESRDPRVAVALGEFLQTSRDEVNQVDAAILVFRLYGLRLRSSRDGRGDPFVRDARAWWKENEADLRRRAKQLPQ